MIKDVGTNLFEIEAQIDISIQISENYVWLSFFSVASVKFIQKLWPKDWWEGNFLNGSEIKMLIDGYYIMASPLLFANVLAYLDVRTPLNFKLQP